MVGKEYLYEGDNAEMDGESFTIDYLSKAFNLDAQLLRNRFRNLDVVSDHNLLPQGPKKEVRRVRFAGEEDYNGLIVGESYTVSEYARESGLNSKTLQNRLRGLEEADERHLIPARHKSNLQNSPFIHEADTARGHELNVISRAALKKPLVKTINKTRKWRV